MNKCYLMGTVLNEPVFEFFFMEDNISICYFLIELQNKYKIKAFALNELADFVYQNIHSKQIICIDGELSSKVDKDMSVKIKNIDILVKGI